MIRGRLVTLHLAILVHEDTNYLVKKGTKPSTVDFVTGEGQTTNEFKQISSLSRDVSTPG